MADEDIVAIPDVPVEAISPETMEKLSAKDYIEVRDEQERLKRHPEPIEQSEETANERPQHKHRNGFEKRIAKLTRRSHESDARATAAETRAEAAERRAAEAEAWRAAHSLNQSGEELVEQVRQQTTEEVRQELLRVDEESKAEYDRWADEARVRYRDWKQVVGNPDIKIPIRVHNAILEMGKDGPAVAYYLGQHPGLCEELMAMKPHAAVARVGRMAAELEREQRERVKPPAPISTVGGSSARSSVPLEEMSMKEFMKVRNAQERARR